MAGINSVDAVSRAVDRIEKQAAGQSGQSGVSFSSILKDTIDQSESLNTQSNQDLLNLLSGNTDDLSGLMVDSQKAEVAISLTAAIRNKAMGAYKEIMEMQV